VDKELKLVIFDCDGTLVDSQAMIVQAMQQAFIAHRIPVPDKNSIRSIIGLSLDQAIEQLCVRRNAVNVSALCDAYKTAFRQIREDDDELEPLYPGAVDFLDKLAARDDVLIGMATGKSRRGVDVLCERESLSNYFSTIQTADTSPSKPDPHMISQAMMETGVDRKNTYMIGDTSYDVVMGRNARVVSLGVSWGYHGVDELLRAGAHGIADEFSDLEAMMPKVFNDISRVA